VGFVLSGCSRLPSSPGSNGIQNPEFVHSTKAPAGSLSGAPTLSSLAGSVSIDGAVGGLVSVGRFTLVIPPGAFEGLATVSITVPDSAEVLCQLGIDPPTANHFAVPVTLRSDCSGTNALVASQLMQLWFDEDAGVWRQVPGSTSDVVNLDVVAPLWHFSDYGVTEGKAGW
jgi:hypothetical protein